MSIALTLDDVALRLHKKNARAVLRLAKADRTFPINRTIKPNLVMEDDLAAWIRKGYPDEAKKMLKGESCTDEASEVSGRSASQELDSRLERQTNKGPKPSRTNSTPRIGTVNTV